MSGVGKSVELGGVRYRILDPTGNITALVESAVPVTSQPGVATAIMERHPQVEQVGFVTYAHEDASGTPAQLRMAGGEFCGNATMCAAALYLARTAAEAGDGADDEADGWTDVLLGVSGASEPVGVRLRLGEDGLYRAGVRMPAAKEIRMVRLASDGVSDTLPVVLMEGISHVVIPQESALFALRDDAPAAERAVRVWCDELGADGLGLMFLSRNEAGYRLAPLVYVPGGDTVFWENSCASGSSAVGMYLASRKGSPVNLDLHEPGGILRVESDPAAGMTWLHGSVRILDD